MWRRASGDVHLRDLPLVVLASHVERTNDSSVPK